MLKKYKKDIIVIFSILLIALVAFLIFEFNKKKGDYIEIIVNGETVDKYDLKIDKEIYISYQDNQYNILKIKDHKAYIIEASCPDKLCCKQHPISKSNETITCLPNKVVIRVVSRKNDIDIESGK